jgi:adenylate cyclase class IV
VPRGRLKIREFADGSGELIAYERADADAPKESIYTRVPCESPRLLTRALGAALPVRGQVVKRREVFLLGRTRVHLDEIAGLGCFVELEVVLNDGEPIESGEREAQQLMHALDIPTSALIAGAYIDLLTRAATNAAHSE